MSTRFSSNFCQACRKFQRCEAVRCQDGHQVCIKCASTSTCALCAQANNPKPTPQTPPKDPNKIKCKFAMRGCKYLLTPGREVENHLSECRFRNFTCEGDAFGCWTCNWTGRYDQIQDHFETVHEESTEMLFKTEALLQLDLTEDYRNISLINYREGQNFFWYKCKLDQEKKKFYSAVQMIGTKQLAEKYCYEFEIFRGPIRKVKVTETCDSDSTDIDSIFKGESCVAISFETLKNYMDEEGNLRFRFRIMSIKKTRLDSDPS